jgi:hypothetical protein
MVKNVDTHNYAAEPQFPPQTSRSIPIDLSIRKSQNQFQWIFRNEKVGGAATPSTLPSSTVGATTVAGFLGRIPHYCRISSKGSIPQW